MPLTATMHMTIGNSASRAQVAEQQRGSPSVSAGCVRAFQGVSPSLVADLCTAAGASPSDPPDALSDGQWAALHAAWLSWLERVQSGKAQSCFPGTV
jgi:predicted ribosome quality control (RQC) complex YloA/Tae2 family protein